MSEEPAYRLVRDALGFYSQVPIEEPTLEVAESEPDVAEELFAVVIASPKKRGRPRRDSL